MVIVASLGFPQRSENGLFLWVVTAQRRDVNADVIMRKEATSHTLGTAATDLLASPSNCITITPFEYFPGERVPSVSRDKNKSLRNKGKFVITKNLFAPGKIPGGFSHPLFFRLGRERPSESNFLHYSWAQNSKGID